MEKRQNFIRKKDLLFILFLILSISLCALYAKVSIVSAELSEVELNETYTLGDSLIIPTAKIKVNGTEYQATSSLICPNGKANIKSEVLLNEVGKYTIEYKTTVNNKVYRENKYFMVYKPLCDVSTKNDIAEYGTLTSNGASVNGIKVSLSQGTTFSYNNILNLNGLTKDDNLFEFYVTPDKLGQYECMYLNVRLTDVYDENNYIKVKFVYGGQNVTSGSYVQAGVNGYTDMFGYLDVINPSTGKPYGYMYGNYGTWNTVSFHGEGFGDESRKGNFSIDYENRKLYTDGAMMLDLNENVCNDSTWVYSDFRLWKGFKTGEVYFTISADGFSKGSMKMLITDILGQNLSQQYASVSDNLIYGVNYDEYTEENYPDALVSHPYKLFEPYVVSKYGYESVKTNVYYGYNTSSMINVPVDNGVFVPLNSGIYTVEYKFIDRFSNETIKLVKINAKNNAPEIVIDLSSYEKTDKECGNYISIADIESLSGGFGNLKIKKSVKNITTNKTYELIDNKFLPLEAGTYRVEYTVNDYVMQETIETYDINVVNGDYVHFINEVNLPNYFISGGKYYLPELFAHDFSTGKLQYAESIVKVKDEDGERAIEYGVAYVPKTANGKDVEIIYEAKSSKNNTSTKKYIIPGISTITENELDISKYFSSGKADITANTDAVSIETTEECKIDFINYLKADKLNIKFALDSSKNDSERINFYLTDSKDSTQRIMVSYIKNVSNGNTDFIVSGATKNRNLTNVFGTNVRDFEFTIKGNDISTMGISETITKTVSGEDFTGFTSKKAYLQIELAGVDGTMALNIKMINDQPFNSLVNQDLIAPSLIFNGIYGGDKKIDEVIEICNAEAVDVLDPYSNVVISVTFVANGKTEFAKDLNTQKVLNKVPANGYYSIKLNALGNYAVKYEYEDGAGNEDSFRYVIKCVDFEKPTVSLSKTELKCKVGENLKLPKVTCSDNNTLAENIKIFINIYTPNGILIEVKNDSYKFTEAGKYIIKYLVIDESSNITTAYANVTVVK